MFEVKCLKCLNSIKNINLENVSVHCKTYKAVWKHYGVVSKQNAWNRIKEYTYREKSQKDYATCKQEADKVFQKMNNNLAWT